MKENTEDELFLVLLENEIKKLHCSTCGRRIEWFNSGQRYRHLLTVAGIEAEKNHRPNKPQGSNKPSI